MKFIAPICLIVATHVALFEAATSDNKKLTKLIPENPVRLFVNAVVESFTKTFYNAASNAKAMDASSSSPDNKIMSGYVTILLGSATACLPVTGVVRVQLGVCVEEGLNDDDDNPTYGMSYVVRGTGTPDQLFQDVYIDANCTTFLNHVTIASFTEGCGNQLQINLPTSGLGVGGAALLNGVNDDLGYPAIRSGIPGLGLHISNYATVTYDTTFNALPAAASSSESWRSVAIYGTADACAQPAANAPVFFAASPVAVMDTCTVPQGVGSGCHDTSHKYNFLSRWGRSWVEGCITVSPQTTGYMMATQWTGGDPQQCTGLIANVSMVASLGQCFPGTAKSGFSPNGVTTAYYRYNAVTQTAAMASATSLPAIAASALQLTEYSDKKCTKPNATEIVASFPFVGCANGVQVKVLPMSPYVINPCFYFRQNGLLSSTTVKPAFPLVPGTWNVTSYYTSAAGCTDITKQARPLYCSAVLSTDPSVTCEPQACSVVQDAQVDPLGLQVGGTCLKVVTPPPTKSPSTKLPSKAPTTAPTRAPTKKGKVVAAAAAAAEAVGAAAGGGLRGSASLDVVAEA